jgi:hypothetical protein
LHCVFLPSFFLPPFKP